MKAIILVGGFGTRLRSVLPDVPKPMAPIHGKPFLSYLLNYLAQQGITQVIFSVHYLREKIQNYFGAHFNSVTIQYAEEAEPLGTGGAIVNSFSFLKTDEPVFVLNGDTFLKLNYSAMFEQHQKNNISLTMALRSVADCSRYGKVIVNDEAIIDFQEKNNQGSGLINAGIYLFKPSLFSEFKLPPQFSIEKDFFFPNIQTIKPKPFITDDYFIDIGLPEDYERAKQELPEMLT